jgi:rare lipoprotein A
MMKLYMRSGRAGRIAHLTALGAASLLLAACTNANMASRVDAGRSVAGASHAGTHVAKTRGEKRATAHVPGLHRPLGYSAVGLASWYGADFHGKRTADGETFDVNSLTAAHRTLPLPCEVRVTNLANHRSIVVRVNDRGPYAGHRLIDVSARTAKLLGFYDRGVTRVKVDYVGSAPKSSGQQAAIE